MIGLFHKKRERKEIRAENGNYVGYLLGNVFHKEVRSSIHKYKAIGRNGSWGCDYKIIYEDLPEKAVIRIFDKDTQTLYQTPLRNYKDKEKATILHFKENTADHSTQIFLPLEHFMQIR